MITLSKSGNSVTFTFDENSGYLQNGTIDVPVNSLSLILDESDMATFRKSASNDIFVSALVGDFGMSKSELEAWYKENMVGSTGGGGGGITSGEVQTMIDESISGKADTSAVTQSINAAVSGKIDSESAVTNVKVLTVSQQNEVQIAQSKGDSTASTFVGTVYRVGSGLTWNYQTKEFAVDSSTIATKTDLASKQDTLSAGTNITISGNVISAEGGSVPYDGYYYIEPFSGETYELEKIDTPFYYTGTNSYTYIEYEGSEEFPSYGELELDYENHTATMGDPSMEEYVSVVWDEKYNNFKVDTLVEGHNITYAENFGYPIDVVPSGTTNETFDNVISYVLSADTEINGKFGNYYTKSESDDRFLNKNDNNFVTFTDDMYKNNQLSGYAKKLVKIQSGFEKYQITSPTTSSYQVTSFGKEIIKESFPAGICLFLCSTYNGNYQSVWNVTWNDVLDGGLNDKIIFKIIQYRDLTNAARLYFYADNAEITDDDQNNIISFNISGKIYYDLACTKEYKNNPYWEMNGEFQYAVNGSGQISSETLTSCSFYANILDEDGFFDGGVSNVGYFYGENGEKYKSSSIFKSHNSDSQPQNGYTSNVLCLVNLNNLGVYDTYFSYDDSFTSYVNQTVNSNGVYFTKQVELIDYSKLTPFEFEYEVNDVSGNSKGTVAITYGACTGTGYNRTASVNINFNTYTLAVYDKDTNITTFNDNDVQGVYHITVDGNGTRTLTLDKTAIEKHYVIENFNYDAQFFNFQKTLYVHYSPQKPPITSGEVQTMIDESVSGKVDISTFETYSGSVETALSGKQDTLSAGTNITISGNVISAEGGGKAIEAGRGISITTGETADTVSFNLPISAGTGTNSVIFGDSKNVASGIFAFAGGSTSSILKNEATNEASFAFGKNCKATGSYSHSEGFLTKANGSSSHAEGNGTVASGNESHAEGRSTSATTNSSHAEGNYTLASGNYSHAEGNGTVASGNQSHAEGNYTNATNVSEHASGHYNVSSSASTTFGDSGNTLFSVGNGTADNARHNAFEIRQNGDIYCSDGTNDVKLQDTITATAANTTALGGLSLVKLTQAEYDALVTKDNSTLYVIVN